MSVSNSNECTNPEVVAILRAKIIGSGLKKKFIADAINISDVYLSILLSGKRTVPAHISLSIINFIEKYNKS